MSQDVWTGIDAYIAEHLVPPDPVLDSALEAASAAGLPQISVAPNQGKLLYILARICGAKNVLELGTLAAYSTIWLARALPEDGRVITVEADAKHALVARANLARAGLSNIVEVWEMDALSALRDIARKGLGPFDLTFIDADKKNIPEYFEWSLRLSRPGSLIIVDNVVREGAVMDAKSTDPNVLGVRRLHEMLASESRVTATTIQTVGIKGHDGFTIALVRD